MVSNNVESTKVQAQRTRGNQESIQHGIDSDRSRGARQPSSENRSESFTADRDDRQGRNFADQRGQAVIGGILDRLITKTLDLIHESENRTADLKFHLQELVQLSDQFKEKSQDS